MRHIRLVVFLCAFADLAMAQQDPTVRVLQTMNVQLAAMRSNARSRVSTSLPSAKVAPLSDCIKSACVSYPVTPDGFR
jgi:hypothetical protein